MNVFFSVVSRKTTDKVHTLVYQLVPRFHLYRRPEWPDSKSICLWGKSFESLPFTNLREIHVKVRRSGPDRRNGHSEAHSIDDCRRNLTVSDRKWIQKNCFLFWGKDEDDGTETGKHKELFVCAWHKHRKIFFLFVLFWVFIMGFLLSNFPQGTVTELITEFERAGGVIGLAFADPYCKAFAAELH